MLTEENNFDDTRQIQIYEQLEIIDSLVQSHLSIFF